MEEDLEQKPDAIKRLGEEIFVPHKARRLHPHEFKIVYIDPKFPKELADKFAIVLIDDACPAGADTITVYADRQKDKTDISLSGNQGSGRAVYYGRHYNILGVGKTSLCTSTEAKHSTGKMELVGSLRRVIISRWINYFSDNRAGSHPIVIALDETKIFKWAKNPLPLALSVRVDGGYLDRPSHVEHSPSIVIDFEKVLHEYAKIDAEFFAYRFMLGAWSNGNYSLDGRIIDLETISFTRHRGPYKTAGSKRIENFFGYEGYGFVLILKQLAEVKGILVENIERRFFEKRKKYLSECLLILLGIEKVEAARFISKYGSLVENLASTFEQLAKKISPKRSDMSLYMGVADDDDPSLLDMSLLFRSLSKLILDPNREEGAFKLVIREKALTDIETGISYGAALTKDGSINMGEEYIRDMAVITHRQKDEFLKNVKEFIADLFNIMDLLGKERCLPDICEWSRRLCAVNQDLPTFNELNEKLFNLVEEYRTGTLSADDLGVKVEKLCELPWYNGSNYY